MREDGAALAPQGGPNRLGTVRPSFPNRLLAALPEAHLALLRPHLEPVDLALGAVLEAPGEPIAFAHFPASGLLSVVAVGPDGQRIEAGLIGREGMSALPVVMGADRSPHETIVQIEGRGHRLPAGALRDALRERPALREPFLLFAQVFAVQAAHTALANGRHRIEERLARWLLMAQDRGDGDILPLTHEFLSLMLGVRRAGVTVALHMLEGQGLIRATRGRIQVIDRPGLEAAAHAIYGVPEAEQARLLGPRPT